MLSTFIDFLPSWLSVGVGYIIAAVLMIGGGYLVIFMPATPLRFVGAILFMVGGDIAIAGYAYSNGLSKGGAIVTAEWKAKNHEAQIDRLKQEADAQKIAADTYAEQTQQLASAKNDSDNKLTDYQTAVENLTSTLGACRRAAGDDDVRMCAITGNAAVGCQHPK